MTTMPTLPYGRPFTRADLDDLPEDGHRYEIIDGTLLVTPAPRWTHQDAVGNLHVLLRAACPSDLRVILAPFDIVLAEDTVVQPDLAVAPRVTITDGDLPVPPMLAVEVLSPSTRRFDLPLERDRFPSAGIASYWLVDPLARTVTVLALDGGSYREVAVAAPGSPAQVSHPFVLTLDVGVVFAG